MEIIFVFLALLAAYYAYTYAIWLRQNGNIRGMVGVYVLIIAGVGLSFYYLLRSK